MPRTTKTGGGDPRLYFGAYHSKFMRDLANCKEITDFLSEIFQVPRRSVRVVTGERSRTKRVLFAGATPAVLDARLSTLLGRA